MSNAKQLEAFRAEVAAEVKSQGSLHNPHAQMMFRNAVQLEGLLDRAIASLRSQQPEQGACAGFVCKFHTENPSFKPRCKAWWHPCERCGRDYGDPVHKESKTDCGGVEGHAGRGGESASLDSSTGSLAGEGSRSDGEGVPSVATATGPAQAGIKPGPQSPPPAAPCAYCGKPLTFPHKCNWPSRADAVTGEALPVRAAEQSPPPAASEPELPTLETVAHRVFNPSFGEGTPEAIERAWSFKVSRESFPPGPYQIEPLVRRSVTEAREAALRAEIQRLRRKKQTAPPPAASGQQEEASCRETTKQTTSANAVTSAPTTEEQTDRATAGAAMASVPPSSPALEPLPEEPHMRLLDETCSPLRYDGVDHVQLVTAQNREADWVEHARALRTTAERNQRKLLDEVARLHANWGVKAQQDIDDREVLGERLQQAEDERDALKRAVLAMDADRTSHREAVEFAEKMRKEWAHHVACCPRVRADRDALKAELAALKAQAWQEPVGWMDPTALHREDAFSFPGEGKPAQFTKPLYAHPVPQREPDAVTPVSAEMEAAFNRLRAVLGITSGETWVIESVEDEHDPEGRYPFRINGHLPEVEINRILSGRDRVECDVYVREVKP